ncbi:hypothetical protein EJ06DRAFT_558992 [Trichodelitschia bisporula]|uniref:CHCH domain-containing protein n=1 Tax=Trichodelitschia bisporula TaxID=703511 RepID=A0A6G1HNV2_9PEZI|nr:hypothetical protein EJ06DRAFT_558992 [Trichodelitschia bisporula]
MPRQSRGPSRPAARPVPPPQRPAAQQTRPASTSAAPPATAAPTSVAQPQQASSGGSGLFGQMASTAAGVAVGSAVGHAVGGWFGGSSAAPAEASSTAAQSTGDSYLTQSQSGPKVCEGEISKFKTCMDQNEGSLTICGWYLDQLKSCQQMASQY